MEIDNSNNVDKKFIKYGLSGFAMFNIGVLVTGVLLLPIAFPVGLLLILGSSILLCGLTIPLYEVYSSRF
jgi:hypothetical protein